MCQASVVEGATGYAASSYSCSNQPVATAEAIELQRL
jgi:hypothetical protein